MKIKVVILLIFVLVLSSCVSHIEVQRKVLKERTHTYNLSIVDINKKPVQGATVHYILKNEANLVKDTTVVTDENGIISVALQATSNLGGGYISSYSTSFNFDVSKIGYSSKTGTLSNNYGNNNYSGNPTVSEVIEFYKFSDYFKPDFLSDEKNVTLVAKILSFMNTLKNQSQISNSVLKWNSIFLSKFKDNLYLSFTFDNINVFNSIKLNKYDIGKTLFDEVVRKILNPLNDNFIDSKLFFGYDITVIGYTKSFIDEYALNKKIIYRFLIPNETVKKYKNKDITGQQVLDQSIILMDDERIDLKLQ
jgi:hypothetical protein